MEAIETIAELAEPCLPRPENIPASGESECSDCQGTGYVLDENRRARRCDCAIEELLHKRLPERYWQARIDNFSPALLERILAWALNPRDGLRLSGRPGTGKTHLAAGLVRHFCCSDRHAKFQRVATIYRELRECYSRDTSEAAKLARLFNAPVLVLDDLGAGALSDFERRITLDILDERLNALRPTVVTSNWTLEEIAARMDDRIASRLATLQHIELSGSDRRVQAARFAVSTRVAIPKSPS